MDASTSPNARAAPTLARRFAEFVHGLQLEQVPAEVSLRARHLMLDAIGCAMASPMPCAMSRARPAKALAKRR